MPCTTLLVGKKASNDGSTIIARTDDGSFDVKKLMLIDPKKQPKNYKSVIAHLTIPLPEEPLRYTSCPNVDPAEGVWPATGINAANVGMSATETITTNPRVLGADPMVKYQKARRRGEKDIPGGIGEEDLVTLVLPYIRSAREGVLRLGKLLEQYGTYESNGIAFNDENEIWWMETIGGHHWIARRVADEECVVMPNQFGLDRFDFEDAFGAGKENLCSADLKTFIEENHLDTNNDGCFNPRNCFGSRSDSDHVYNTPRAWFLLRYFNPRTKKWDGPMADYTPESDDLPWCMVPEKKITIEDVKYALSAHFQGTPYDPYAAYGDDSMRGAYRSIGINRNDFLSVIQMRPENPVEWIAFASNAFNVLVPFYTDVEETPAYVSNTAADVSTDNFYWVSRLIAAMADASYKGSIFHLERYQEKVMSEGHAIINRYDDLLAKESDPKAQTRLRQKANEEMAQLLKKDAATTLDQVLFELSNQMKNCYARSDA